GGGADVAAAVEARQPIGLVQPTRDALGLVVVVVHRIPPVHGDAGTLAARDHRGRRRCRHGRAHLRAMRVHQRDERTIGRDLVIRLRGVHLLPAKVIVGRCRRHPPPPPPPPPPSPC